MKKLTTLLLLSFLAINVSAQLNDAEREFAINYLTSTQQNIIDTVSDLSDEAFNYTPKAGGWSTSNCLEHILVSEGAFFQLIQGTLQGESDSDFNNSAADAVLIGILANRGTKATTAPQFEPSGKWETKAEMLEALEMSRAKLIEFLESSDADLRHFKAALPFGEIDLYQVLLINSAHSQRHTFQMAEVLGEFNAM